MAPPSALAGNPPLNEHDTAIIKGLNQVFIAALKVKHLIPAGTPPPTPDPSKGIRRPPFRPPPSEYHFETRGPKIITSASIAIAFMILFTGTRLIIRARNAKLYFGKDDWAILFGTLIAIAVPATNIAQVHYAGLGKHTYDCTYYEWYMYQKLMPTQYLLLFEALSVVKISIVLLYMRLSGFTSRRWLVVQYTILFVLVSHMIASLFVHLYLCSPIAIVWDLIRIGKLDHQVQCIDQSRSYAILNSFHIVTDFSLFIVPITMLWKVHMKWTKKFQICIAGCVGLTSCAFAIMRTISSYRIVITQPMWSPYYIIIWAHVDLTTAVVAASLPVLSFLLARMSHFFKTHWSPTSSQEDPLKAVFRATQRQKARPRGHPLSLPTDLDTERGDGEEPGKVAAADKGIDVREVDSSTQCSSETAVTDDNVATYRHYAERKA